MWKRCWNAVVAVAKRIGQVQAWLILSVLYFVLMAPIALFFQLTADPLRLRPRLPRKLGGGQGGRQSGWCERFQPPNGLEWAKHQ